ncbi:MAG: hypothetical protein WCB26_17545 [Pseudolabrys sp.]
MLKRFVRAFLAFVGIIVPGTFALALLIAPIRSRCNRQVASAVLPM